MTTRNLQTRLLFDGGWATDFGPTAQISIDQSGIIQVPYLVNAENVVYDLDGGPKKIGGTEQVNSSALNGGATIRGLVDFWVSATTANYRVVHVGNDLMADNGAWSFASILGGEAARNTSAVPSYAVYDNDLIIMSDLDGEYPLKWSSVGNVAALGTNTPKFSFGVTHKNRFFAAGVIGNRSRVYYSEPLPNGVDGNWDAIEAGYFDVDPDDGDEVRGLASHKGILLIFKGPNMGSIHRLAGDTPLGGVTAFASSTQPVPFELDVFIRGVGAAGHNSIFRFRDDIGFIDAKTGSIRSLNATEKYGDFREAALSFPINDFLLKRINKSALKGAWAENDVACGAALITVPTDTETDNNVVLCMDYRFDPPRWSQWPSVVAKCLTSVIDTNNNNRQSIFIGDVDGFVRRTGIANKSIDGTTAINYKVTLPHLDFGNPVAKKTFARAAVGIEPKGSYNGTFGWTRDDNAQQTQTFDQGGGDVLAGVVNTKNISQVSKNITVVGDKARFFTTPHAHGFSVDDIVAISGTTNYNGVYTITAIPSPASFDVDVDWAGNDSGKAQISTTANFFTLGTSTLAGARFVDRFFSLEEGGEFRSVQFELTQNVVNQDIEVHSLFAEIELGADSTEN